MKITFELPDSLVKSLKYFAMEEGMKLKDAYALIIERGLNAPVEHANTKLEFVRSPLMGFPSIKCNRIPGPGELDSDRVKQIIQDMDEEYDLAAAGLQHLASDSDRRTQRPARHRRMAS